MHREKFRNYLDELISKDQISKNDLLKFSDLFEAYNYLKSFYIEFRDGAQGIDEIIKRFEIIINKILRKRDSSVIYLLLRQGILNYVDIKKFPELKDFEWLILLNKAIEALLSDSFQDWKKYCEINNQIKRALIHQENHNKVPIYLNKAISHAPSSELELIKSPNQIKYGKYKELFDFLQIPLVIFKLNIMEIEETEVRLGIKIPDSVKEWYSIFASKELLKAFSMEKFLELSKLKIDRKIVQIIRSTDQYSFGFGFLISEDEDPNVYYWNEESEWNDKGEVVWNDTGERFSNFIYNFFINIYFVMLDRFHYSVILIYFNKEITKIKFIECIKKDFKKIEINTPDDTIFGSNIYVENGLLTDYFHSSSLEMYITIPSSKEAYCYYKSEEKVKKFLKNLCNWLNVSQDTLQNIIPIKFLKKFLD